MHTQDQHKVVGLAQGFMATGLTGAQLGWHHFRGSAEAQSSLHVSGFLSHSTPKQRYQRLSDEHRELGMLTATEVLVCFGLLLITTWHSGKAYVPAATSLVKTLSGQLQILTVVWFGCPLIKLELWKQGSILQVLLHIQGHMIKNSRGAKMVEEPKKINRSALPDKKSQGI